MQQMKLSDKTRDCWQWESECCQVGVPAAKNVSAWKIVKTQLYIYSIYATFTIYIIPIQALYTLCTLLWRKLLSRVPHSSHSIERTLIGLSDQLALIFFSRCNDSPSPSISISSSLRHSLILAPVDSLLTAAAVRAVQGGRGRQTRFA